MRDIIYVAASGLVLHDRESSGHHSRPTLYTEHHTHTETMLSRDFRGAASPATARAMTHVVGQELA
jgi:hypothetical protein